MRSGIPLAAIAWLVIVPALGFAQAPPQPAPPRSAKDAAPVDFTGYWVSPVMEDYRWRMITPLKGDAASVPINAAARKIVDAWNPAADEAAGLQCKAYGAPAIMRVPGRLHITWQDDNTLKIETDAGTQTRLLRFAATLSFPPGLPARDWQGFSSARWWNGTVPPPPGAPLGLLPRSGGRPRTLEVHTENLREGYLRKNGVPYSDKTTLAEYYDLFKEPDGETWFTVTTVVTDPVYLAVPFVTTTDFRKEPDGSKWDPSPCTSR